ncbi:MAG TPA: TonB-dependent siderophore receptor [Thermoanaerobaculia bacterium]|nr:TonB-dependent siderophore receptor [Thermoanaerobaculia bacterium]
MKKREPKSKKRSGRSPRWLVWGALAATTSLSGRLAVNAYAQENRRFELPQEFGKTSLYALMNGAEWTAAEPGRDEPVHRFDIPPGRLGTVIAAFEAKTGIDVQVESAPVGDIASPGVSGLLTADRALRELLRDTGVTYRFTGTQTVLLELRLSESLDVTVTAPAGASSPKYTEPLRDTPQTITVIPREMIEAQGATTLREVLRNVTGISIQAGEGGGGLPGDNLSIRGFAARNDIFVDGVRDFGAYTRDPFNIEQVEVAKGPSSLYTGRGSTGGAVNLSSKLPLQNSIQSATVGVGTEDFNRATIDFNQPMEGFAIPGTAIRVNAMWNHGDVAGRDVITDERWGIAPSIAFGLGTPTRVTVSFSRLDQDNIPEYGLPWVPNTNVPLAEYADQAPPVDFDNFYGLKDRDYERTTTDLATATVEHDFGNSTTLRSLVRHGRATRDSIITAPRFASTDGTNLNRQLQSRDLTDTILAQQNDLTFRFETGTLGHSLVAGTEVLREDSKNYARTGPTAPLADLFNPDPNAPYPGPVTRTGARTESTADTVALYANDTVKLNERWEVTGGLRWDRFNIDFESVAVDGVVTPFERTDEMLSWRAGVVNKPLPNGSIYAAASTSFNPSADGNIGLSLAASTADLEPEKSRSFEIGTKWDLFDARLAMSTAIFQTEKTNARTPGINPGDPATVLKGEQRIRGMEIGGSGLLTDRWTAFFGYTWLDSEIVKSNTATEVGSEFANAPEHSASLWMTYRLPRGFELGGGFQYIGDRLNSTTTRRIAPSYTLYDAMASYKVNERFTLRVNVNNLADERYIDRVGGGHFIPGAGRSVSLTTSVDF